MNYQEQLLNEALMEDFGQLNFYEDEEKAKQEEDFKALLQSQRDI